MTATSNTRKTDLSRRDFLKLGGAALAGSSLGIAGCAGERRKGPIKLIFSHGEQLPILRGQITRFNVQNEGRIEVEFRQAPADTGQYFDWLRTAFQANQADVDVISGDVIWPAQLAAEGWISDLSDRFGEELRERYLPAATDSSAYEGSVYGVPWFTDAGLLYYRRDLLEDSGFDGPPETWEELKQMADKAMQDRGTKFGFVFQGANYEGGVVNGLEYIWSSGGGVLDPNDLDKVIVDAPRAVEGLRIERGMVTDGISPESVSSYKEYESYAVFLAGEAVFMRNWPNVYARAADPSLSNVEQERIGIAPLPAARPGGQGHSALGGWNLMISAASGKADAAWTFIRWMTAPEQQKQRALEGGYLPTLKDCYEDKEILARLPVMSLGEEAIRTARSRPATPFYYEMSRAMAGRFHASLTGSASPEKSTAALKGDLEKILERSEEG